MKPPQRPLMVFLVGLCASKYLVTSLVTLFYNDLFKSLSLAQGGLKYGCCVLSFLFPRFVLMLEIADLQ